MKQILLNSKSSGKFRTEFISNREFLVTRLIAAESNSVMNGVLYDASIVNSISEQLTNVPAPSGHPTSNGVPISASDSVIGPSFSFGAHIRNSEVKNGRAEAELWIDVAVASNVNDGRKIINLIETGNQIPVSVGGRGKVQPQRGKNTKGDNFFGKVIKYTVDHLAVLLREPPAGELTYTLNSSDFLNQNQKGNIVMRKVTIDTYDLSLEQHKLIESAATNPQVVIDALNHQVTASEAEAILNNSGKVVFAGTQHQIDDFLNNAEDFAVFKAAKSEARKEQVDFVINNSKMSEGDISDMNDAALQSLVNSITPANKHIAPGQIDANKEFTMPDGL